MVSWQLIGEAPTAAERTRGFHEFEEAAPAVTSEGRAAAVLAPCDSAPLAAAPGIMMLS